MKKDHVMLRLPCIFGPEWLQAYALVDVVPEVDPMEFRFELPRRLNKFHEVENYLGGTPGDLFIGFFANGQTELLQEIGKIKAMKEVANLKEWAIANFPIGRYAFTVDDWRILKHLRAGNVTQDLAFWFKPDPATLAAAAKGGPLPPMPVDKVEKIAGAVGLPLDRVKARLEFMKAIPLGVMLQVPDPGLWEFIEIHFKFNHTTFEACAPELMKLGRPFAAESHLRQGAIMIEQTTIADLRNMIQKLNKVPGVSVCDFAFSEDMLWTQPWLDAFLEEKIKTS